MVPMVAAAVMAGVGAITSMAQSSSNRKLAREQMDRQRQLRAEALKIQAPKVSSSYLEAEKMREIAMMKGLPGYNQYEEGIQSNTADLAAKGKQAALSGGDYLAYLSSLYGHENQSIRDLNTQDANSRADSFNKLIGMKTMIGQEQSRNEAIKRNQQDTLYKQANDLETAATENRQIADKQMINAVGSGFSGILGGMAGSPAGTTGGEYKSVFDKAAPVEGITEMGATNVSSTQPQTPAGIDMTGYTNDQGTLVTPKEEEAAHNILEQIGIPASGSNNDIKSVQGYLKGMGYYTGSVDGKYGDMTKEAMNKYLENTDGFVPQDLNSYYAQSYVRPR